MKGLDCEKQIDELIISFAYHDIFRGGEWSEQREGEAVKANVGAAVKFCHDSRPLTWVRFSATVPDAVHTLVFVRPQPHNYFCLHQIYIVIVYIVSDKLFLSSYISNSILHGATFLYTRAAGQPHLMLAFSESQRKLFKCPKLRLEQSTSNIIEKEKS